VIVYGPTMAKLSARGRLAALDSLTGVLLDANAPGSSRAPSFSSGRRRFHWTDVIAVAEELLVMPALARAISDRALSDRAVSDRAGLDTECAPAALTDQLRDQWRWNTLRNARLRRQLLEALTALNEAGVTPLLFKGALNLLDGTLAGIGDRYMSDLDLMVPTEQRVAARAALEGLGYAPDPASPFHQPHELGFHRTGTGGPIDLHTEFGDEPLITVLPAADAWRDSTELVVEERRARGLSPTHQVLHNVLHAAVLDLNHAIGGLPFRQLLALEKIVRTQSESIDWPALALHAQAHGLTRELRDHLWLARRFAGAEVPSPATVSRATAPPAAIPDPESYSGGWGWQPRAHELRVRAGFALGWPPHVQRNLHYAFGPSYLESLYGTDAGFSLARARARHAVKLLRGSRSRALGDAVLRRI
jgi:hypothetical protein